MQVHRRRRKFKPWQGCYDYTPGRHTFEIARPREALRPCARNVRLTINSFGPMFCTTNPLSPCQLALPQNRKWHLLLRKALGQLCTNCSSRQATLMYTVVQRANCNMPLESIHDIACNLSPPMLKRRYSWLHSRCCRPLSSLNPQNCIQTAQTFLNSEWHLASNITQRPVAAFLGSCRSHSRL